MRGSSEHNEAAVRMITESAALDNGWCNPGLPLHYFPEAARRGLRRPGMLGRSSGRKFDAAACRRVRRAFLISPVAAAKASAGSNPARVEAKPQ